MGRTSNADQRLKEAALELIWKNSYGAVTVDAICEKAGVNKGSFYHFFESKSELATVALDGTWEENRSHWDETFSPSVPPLDRIRDYFTRVLERQRDEQKQCGNILGCRLFTLGSEVCTQDEAIRIKVHEILQNHVKYFETAIRDALADGLIEPCEPRAKARGLFALYEGILTQARIQNDIEPIKSLPGLAFDLLRVKRARTVA